MRVAQELYVKPGAQKSRSTSVPAPIGGLNARDGVDAMDEKDAVVLENWFPKPTSVDVRNGYSAWSTFTGLCQTIIVYSGVTATKIFPCVKNGSTYSIYNGTSAGALSVAQVGGAGNTVEALTSARFDYAMIGTSGGNFLSAVNGADVALEYDGTTWTASADTGIATTALFTVGVYSSRLWYGQKDTLRVWYGPTASKSGALTVFELGPVFKLGGYLNSIITVTDASNTLNDYIVFLSSEGELVAYTGDPSTTFTRVAQFQIGRPAIKGNRCWVKWGTDAAVLCADGVYPLRKAISANARSEGLAISDKIRDFINADVQVHGTRLGWEVIVHPTGAKLIVNVPTAEDAYSYQWVMNTQSGAWTKFTGWNAFCFSVARDTLWMGLSGKMVKADVTGNDGTAAIFTEAQQAYNYYGARGRVKHMKLARPILAANGAFNFGIQIETDFRVRPLTYLRPIMGGSGDPWGSGTWDAAWAGSADPNIKWYGVTGVGRAISTRIKTRTDGTSISWSTTNVVYEYGGVL